MYSPSLAFSVDAFVLMLHHKLLHPSWASYWHSHTNIGQVTMFSTMGNLNEGVAGGQDQNHTHKTGMCSAPSAISKQSRHSLKEDRHRSRHGLKKDRMQVRTSVRSYSWSDNAPCTLIQ